MGDIRRVAVLGTADPIGMPTSVARGFEALGLAVGCIPYADWFPAVRLPFRGAGLLNRALAELSAPVAAGRALLALRGFRPDLVVVMKCDDLPYGFHAALRAISGARVAAFHPDDPWNVGHPLRPGPSHWRALAGLRGADTAFLWSHALVARAAAMGIRARWLPFACDPVLHPPEARGGPDATGLGADVVFIGNWDPERERILAPLAESGCDLALWGTDYWRDRCRNRALVRAWRGRPLLAAEQAEALRTSRLAVNVLRAQNKGATNMRTFEIPCMGGVMLHERSAEAAHFFPEGEAALYFDGPEGLVRQAQAALARPRGELAAIAREGQRRALGWTYREWAEALLAGLET